MTSDRPSSPLLIFIAVGVLALAAFVLWSSGRLFTDATDNTSALVTTDMARTRPASVPDSSEQDSGTTPAAAKATPAPANDEPALKALRALLHKPHAVPNEAVISFQTRGDLADFLRQAAKRGLRIISTINGLNAVRVGFDDEKQLAAYLAEAGGRASIDPNFFMSVPQLPKRDTLNQNGTEPVGERLMSAINATADRSSWGKGLTVAVLDTGVKAHPTFADGQVTHVDLVNDGKPFHSHGTSVASLIAGQDDRVPGVAPGASILDIRVANDKGYSVSSVLAQGIVEAVDRGAQVINISLGGYDDSAVLRAAAAYAAQKHVFIVAAAGNESYNQLAYPAAIPGVISVGAVDGQNKQAFFSNSGQGLTIVAPGVGLDTAWDVDKAAIVSGTSQATGVVTGVVVANYSLGISWQDMLRRLQSDAVATGAPSDKVGSGVVQVTGKRSAK